MSAQPVKKFRAILPALHAGQVVVREQAKRFNWLSAGRRWRKTTLLMAIALESAAQGKNIIWGAPVLDQARTGWGEMMRACALMVNEKAFYRNETRLEVILPNFGFGQGSISFRSLDNPDNVRSKTADGVVIDEAGYAAPAAWHEVLRPMLMDTGGWAWIIGTPDGLNWFHDGFEDAPNHDDSMCWQAPTLGVKVENGQLVRAPHPLENPNIKFDEMFKLWQTTPEDTFKQEYLAEFISDSGAVFRFINEAAKATSQDSAIHSHIYIIGVDPAQRQDFTVVSVIDATIGELCYLDRFNNLEYLFQLDRIRAVCERFRPEMVIFEETGNLALVEAAARTQYYHSKEGKNLDIPIYAFKTTNASKVQVIQDLALAFERRSIRILNDRVLKNELLAFNKEKTDSGVIKYSAPTGKNDDCVMSLAFAWSQAKEYLSEDTLNARERAERAIDKSLSVEAIASMPPDSRIYGQMSRDLHIQERLQEEQKGEQSWLQKLDGWIDS